MCLACTNEMPLLLRVIGHHSRVRFKVARVRADFEARRHVDACVRRFHHSVGKSRVVVHAGRLLSARFWWRHHMVSAARRLVQTGLVEFMSGLVPGLCGRG